MTQKISEHNAYELIFFFSKEVDLENWKIEDLITKNSFHSAELLKAEKKLNTLQQNFLNNAENFPSGFHEHTDHVKDKFNHLKNKLVTLQPSGTVVPHQQFKNAITQNESPSLLPSITLSNGPALEPSPYDKNPLNETPQIYKPLSFSLENSNGNQPQLSPLQVLDRVSFLLRNENEQQALNEFSCLPSSIQKAVYKALWTVKGKPMGNHPIAHDNFGEVSFKNMEPRCHSTLQEKACAVELAKIFATLLVIADTLENKKDQSLANQIFRSLPSKIQNEIFGKHWHEMGEPTDQSPDENLRKISHSDFGQVSFLGTDERCDVLLDKKARTVMAYIKDYIEKMDSLQDLIQKKQTEWKDIDQSSIGGAQKNSSKKDSLDLLAQSIIPQFLDKTAIVKPTRDAFKSLAAAYVETYPILRPLFLQMVPDLKFANETLPQGEIQSVKSSQAAPPHLESMNDQGRKDYRTSIMMETLATLQIGYYINSKGQKVVLHLKPAVDSLERQSQLAACKEREGTYNTKILLDNEDCLTVTRKCVIRGLNPILLDAASIDHFGGGYMTGAGAQEEYITRCSGLSVAVDPRWKMQKQTLYPLTNQDGKHVGLYVSHIPVFRGEEKDGYPYLDQPFEIPVGIYAAYNFNEHGQQKTGVSDQNIKRLVADPQTGELRIPEEEAMDTKRQLRNFLETAQKKGHDSVVLVPLGCGAFCNPPKHVCEMLMELITQEFPHSFKEIHISIIDDHNTGKAHNPQGNYTVFKETIENRFLNTNELKKINATFKVNSL